jgi:multiple sugar transport system substrate-binding protein
MFKRRMGLAWRILGLLLVAFLALTACGPAAEEPAAEEPAAEEPAAEEPREIVWMVRTNETENPWEQEIAIPNFEKEHPDIKVNLLIIDQPDIAMKREAMIAAGEPLHVWSTNWGGDGFASDRSRGLITDLTPLIEKDNVDTSVFIPEVLDIYKSEGKIWGLPFLTTGSYIFYNMELFDEAGIPYPTTDWDDKSWTWDAAVEIAKQLTKDYGDPVNAQYGWIQGRQNIEGPAMIFGKFPWPEDAYDTGFAESIDLSDPAVIEAYQAHHDLLYVHKVSPDGPATDALSQLGGAFESGRVAMNQTGGWGWWIYSTNIDTEAEEGFCWGVAPNPWGSPDAEERAVIYTDPWVITRGLEGQELEDAWAFVKFLISEDQARAYMQAGNVPPTQHKLQEEWFEQYTCMDPADVKEVYQGAFRYGLESSNHLMVRWDALQVAWNNVLSAMFNDPDADVAAELTQLEADLNEILQQIAEEEGHEF